MGDVVCSYGCRDRTYLGVWCALRQEHGEAMSQLFAVSEFMRSTAARTASVARHPPTQSAYTVHDQHYSDTMPFTLQTKWIIPQVKAINRDNTTYLCK